MDKTIIKELFIISNKLKRMLDKKYQAHNMHTGQARVLMYLYRHKDEVTYQKDIEHGFEIRGGTVTGMIDTLEKYAYIQRIDSDIDKRKKMIVLTELGKKNALNAIKTTKEMEDGMYQLLNKTERSVFETMFSKINKWIDKEELDEKTI